MIKKGTLSNGFKYEVDDAVMDDMRLIDAISESMEDEPLKISKVIKMVLGEEQRERLYKMLEDENGRVPADVASEAIAEIFENMGEEGKN